MAGDQASKAWLLACCFVVFSCGVTASCPGIASICSGHGTCVNERIKSATRTGCKWSEPEGFLSPIKFDGEPVGEVLAGIGADWSVAEKDRKFRFYSCFVEAGVDAEPEYCSTVSNNAGDSFQVRDEVRDMYLTGVSSEYKAGTGRGFDLSFCMLSGISSRRCSRLNNFVNEVGKGFNFTCPDNQFLSAVSSDYDNSTTDNLWKFSCCSVQEGGNDKCQCNAGWQGRDCSELKCPGAPECSGNGKCVAGESGGVCGCDAEYFGESCESLKCPDWEEDQLSEDMCSGNGACDLASGLCKCARGFRGEDCGWPFIDYESNAEDVADVCQTLMQDMKGSTAARGPNGNCYVGVAGKATFVSAREHCERFGAHVVSATTAAESSFLGSTFGGLQGAWVGLGNVGEQWQWTSGEIAVDGEGALYSAWEGGKPSGAGQCAFANGGDFKWKPASCSAQKPVICEFARSPQPLKPDVEQTLSENAKRLLSELNNSSERVRSIVRTETDLVRQLTKEMDGLSTNVNFVRGSQQRMLDQALTPDLQKELGDLVTTNTHAVKLLTAYQDSSLWVVEDEQKSAKGSLVRLRESLGTLGHMQTEISSNCPPLKNAHAKNSDTLATIGKSFAALVGELAAKKEDIDATDEQFETTKNTVAQQMPVYMEELSMEKTKVAGAIVDNSSKTKENTAAMRKELAKKIRMVRVAYKILKAQLVEAEEKERRRREFLAVNKPGIRCKCRRGRSPPYTDAAKPGMLCKCVGPWIFEPRKHFDQIAFQVIYDGPTPAKKDEDGGTGAGMPADPEAEGPAADAGDLDREEDSALLKEYAAMKKASTDDDAPPPSFAPEEDSEDFS